MTRSNGRPGVSGAHAFEHLSVEECWQLVDGAEVGRLAVTGADGTPDVFPLNVLAHDGALYARSAAGSKLSIIADHPEAAIEFDGEKDGYRWSVVARGPAARLETDVDAATDAEIEASGVLRLASTNRGGKPYVIRLRPVTVSGRRIRLDAADTSSGSTPVTGPIVNSKRAQPPRPIPHHPPPKA
ncbi:MULTISPECIES: pyridoxamine 5'-phosphate oxidase family protein [unclassified Microbacterium]|uniref:pyridoxamine 5'-phosphate oxidase family protein n=1 Tax=unclassified Microbacterium TaxID=2609290 RepID=UPI000C2C7DA7|nr:MULTISPECIES: pyridoxamine 5'-phosphate oxidase family protein [unclassified Microbacterium]